MQDWIHVNKQYNNLKWVLKACAEQKNDQLYFLKVWFFGMYKQ